MVCHAHHICGISLSIKQWQRVVIRCGNKVSLAVETDLIRYLSTLGSVAYLDLEV